MEDEENEQKASPTDPKKKHMDFNCPDDDTQKKIDQEISEKVDKQVEEKLQPIFQAW